MDFLSPADRFRAAAIVLDDGRDEDREALFEALKRCASELLASGVAGLAEMAELMDDESAWAWAAIHLLSTGEPAAAGVLARLSERADLVGFSAQVALDEHRAGRLKSPFSDEA